MTHPAQWLNLRSGMLWMLGLLSMGIAPTEAGAYNEDTLQVVPVPFAPNNLDLPLPVHERARITLKAILRGAQCDAGYYVAWDTDRDGNYDDESSRLALPTPYTQTVYDIGQTYEVPTVTRGTTLTLNVRAVSKCNPADEAYGTYRIYVYDWTPSSDPTKWSKDQLEVMSNLAIHEALWWMHRSIESYGGSGSAITAKVYHNRGDTYRAASHLASLWAYSANGRLPAYPPGSLNTYGMSVSADWHTANDARWRDDPYAETMIRLVNWTLDRSNGVHWYGRGVMANNGDEDNTCGWAEDGTELRCPRIADTNNGGGTWTGYDSGVYMTGLGLGALSTLLPALAGTPVQTGHSNNSVKTKPWEWYVQEMVDWLGYMQHDSGCALGGWRYTEYLGNSGCGEMDASTAQWGYIGLESAEIAGKPYGVVVNNRLKYRIAANLIQNQGDIGDSNYRTSNRNNGRTDFQLTGGAIVGARWLGFHEMAPTAEKPFLPYADVTKAQMVDSYQRYLSFSAQYWNSGVLQGQHWKQNMWHQGDYLCGTPSGVYNAPRCGNTYALYSFQKGFRTGTPELLKIGGHDWAREFDTYYVRAQARDLNDYKWFGHFNDDRWTSTLAIPDVMGYPMGTPFATLVLTPTIFRPKPVAQGDARPTEVIEGCAGGGQGKVTFDHSASFHPNREANIVAYQWDVDDSDGLWWETGAPKDYETDSLRAAIGHVYNVAGIYTATLRVVDDDATSPLSSTRTVKINVAHAPAADPGAVAGGPYMAEVGSSLTLAGRASDANEGCGDVLTATWDLDGDGAFDDASGLSPTLSAETIGGYATGVAHPIRLRVVDSTGRSATADGTLTVYSPLPVVRHTVNPEVAACRQQVRFDASASYHESPARRLVRYTWDVVPGGGVEGESADGEFSYSYPAFGTYPGTVTVTDDLGRTAQASFTVEVSAGNRAPVARLSEGIYSVAEGDDLVVDGRPSSDPDSQCGDGIVEYAWDLNGDGDFDGPGDARGAQVTIPWAALSQLRWPADRNSGLPVNPIALRVTDGQGLQHTVIGGVRIYQTRPIAVITQSPAQAPIRGLDGVAVITLDGRASYSPVPGRAIARYDWDLNDDGTFEAQDEAVVRHQPVFWPVPDVVPEIYATLRVTDDAGATHSVRQQISLALPGQAHPTAIPHPAQQVGGEHVGGPDVNGGHGGYHFFVGEAARLDASASFDPDPDDHVARYRWDLDRDGIWDLDLADEDGDKAEAAVEIAEAMKADLGWDAAGSFDVALEVTDTTGRSHTAYTTVYLYDRAPEVEVVVNPNPATCGGQINLDASSALQPHPDADVVAWRWDLDGDGEFDDGVGEILVTRFGAFTFGAPIPVAVEVEDTAGHVAQAEALVTVSEGNQPPVAEAGRYSLAFGGDLALDGSASADPDAACGDAILHYRWDLNRDGVVDVTGADPVVPAATLAAAGLDAPGQYTVALEVVDRFGRVGRDEAQVWLVAPPVAVAQASKATAGCNEQVTFTASASVVDGPDDDRFAIETYEWDMDGDGIFERSGETVLVPVVASAAFTATLRVVDAQGRASTDQVTVAVSVANVRPVADAGGPYVTAMVGLAFVPVDLDARGSLEPNAPCDAIAQYAWDTDNDGLYGAADLDGAGGLVGSDYVGAVIRDYVSPQWRVGTTQVVRVKAQDSFGAWSDPAEAEIRARLKMPPSGELIWPRAGDCVAGDVELFEVAVGQPGGGAVTLTAKVGGAVVGTAVALLPVGGEDLTVQIPVTANLAAEGLSSVTVTVVDDEGGETTLSSGGQVAIDRTGPVVHLNPALVDGACYAPGATPAAQVQVVDAIDPAPAVSQRVESDVCLRTLEITATDACGNTTVAQRGWALAERFDPSLVGPEANAVVAEARFSWAINAPAQCVTSASATLTPEGGVALPYIEGSAVSTPGQYRFDLTLTDCQGGAYGSQRAFRVNAPPVAIAGGPYVGSEGHTIILNGGASLPPELSDFVEVYEWDMNGDGVYELVGEQAPFVAADSGVVEGRLQITDSFGSVDQTTVVVSVLEVHPLADGGGPYLVTQNNPLTFDATRSRPGSPADLITGYTWDFGDGSPTVSGPDLTRPVHTYAADGVYTARLTVHDEDSSATALIPVTVADVEPRLSDIVGPLAPYEVVPWGFSVIATPGNVDEPLEALEWDFGDGSDPVSGLGLEQVTHSWRDAGTYTVTVTLRDVDSVIRQHLEVTVRPITLEELLGWLGETLPQVDQGPLVSSVLDAALPLIERGIWAEQRGERGTALMAVERVISLLVNASAVGAELDDTAWLIVRQVRRALGELYIEVTEGEGAVSLDHPSLIRAEDYLATADELLSLSGIEDRLGDPIQGLMSNDIFAALFEAFFYLNDAADPCKAPEYNGYNIPIVYDLVERTLASQSINDDLNVGIGTLSLAFQRYAERGLEAPGRPEVLSALQTLRVLQQKLAMPIGLECEDGSCISDHEALELLLGLMDLSTDLNSAKAEGVYVRNWQACLVEGVKFRTGLSEMRLEYICGPYSPVTLRARITRANGMRLVEDNQVVSALEYFQARSTRCLAIWTYNTCLVPAIAQNEAYPVPAYCEEEFGGGGSVVTPQD